MKIARSTPAVLSSWFKSSYSNGAGGECVECAHAAGGVLVRDSKNIDGPVLDIRSHAWRIFLQALQGRP